MLDWLLRWETLFGLMLLLYVPSCVILIVIVLLQKGKGTGFAGAFGIGGGSDTVFGPRGGKSLPVKLTYVAAAVFMILALSMSMVSGKLGKGKAPEKVQGVEMDVLGTSTDFDDTLGDLGSGLAEEPAEAPEGDAPAAAGDAAGSVTVVPAETDKPAEAAPEAPETPGDGS